MTTVPPFFKTVLHKIRTSHALLSSFYSFHAKSTLLPALLQVILCVMEMALE